MSANDPKRAFNVRPRLRPHVLRGIYNSASFAFAAGFCGGAKDGASAPCKSQPELWSQVVSDNRYVIGNIDDRHRTASRGPCFRFDERWRSRQLPSRDCRHYGAYFGLEYATWDSVESDLRIVACIDPLQGILIKRRSQFLIPLTGIDEHHGGSKLRRYDVHTGSQRNLRHKTRTSRANRGLIKIELGIGKFRTPLRHSGIHAADIGRIGEPRALLFGLRRR